MNTDLRRSKRFNDFIAVAISFRKENGNAVKKGPFTGRIINISHHGACLLMSLGSFASYKKYRSTSERNNLLLEIETSCSQKQLTLSARPIWTDPFTIDDLCGFKMGVEFDTQEAMGQSGDPSQISSSVSQGS